MTSIPSQTIIVDPRPAYPLQILANRYSPPHASKSGYTVILLHATGMHKESWEIVLQKLFTLSGNNILEAYSIESPNHGESATLNEDALKEKFHDTWPTREYARATHFFLTAGLTSGAKVDFSKRRLIGIGHSIGAPALCLMRELLPSIRFESLILLEPGISLKGNHDTNVASQALTSWTWMRRDTWKNAKSAKRELESSPMYASWDPRALDLYVEHALRKHPAANFKPPFNFNGVTTALTKEQEAASYRSDELVVDGLEAYTITTRDLPVHVIWGSFNDIATPELEHLLADQDMGRTPASVRHIEDAGHLVVQQQPDVVAEQIHEILSAAFATRPRL